MLGPRIKVRGCPGHLQAVRWSRRGWTSGQARGWRQGECTVPPTGALRSGSGCWS